MDAISKGADHQSAPRRAGGGGWWWVGLVLIFFATAQSGEAATIKTDVLPVATRTRSGAPSLVEVKLSLSGASLLQGRLELALSRYGSTLAVVRSQELAVTPTGLSLRMVLPPLRGSGEFTISAKFLTDRGVLPAGESQLWTLPGERQNFLMAVVGGRAQAREGETRLWQQLRLERFMDPAKAAVANWSTTPAFLELADLPESPLALCAFDLVLLEGESFARLRRRQLDALVQWVEGGGSVFIAGAGTISADHLAALHRLVPPPAGTAALERDPEGKLIPPAAALTLARPELGRCLLVPAPPTLAEEYESAEWREAVAFLWKMSPAWSALIRRGEPRIGPNDGRTPGAGAADGAIAERLQEMFPRTVRMLPVGVIAGILAGFVLTVGPGEWFILGWLRRRRWTWLVFPLAATAFTGVTVLAANHYLGRSDHRAAIVISDLGRGGRVLRESQFAMVMLGESRTYRTELARTFQVPTNLGRRFYYSAPESTEPPLYDGQHPLRCTFSQSLKQWEPRIFRSFTFDAAPIADALDWDAVSVRDLANANDPASLFTRQGGAGADAIQVYHEGRIVGAGADTKRQDSLIRHLCEREHGLLGKIVSAFSPSGDAEGTDLALHDTGDPREWVVIAFSQSARTLHIRRRIYRTDE